MKGCEIRVFRKSLLQAYLDAKPDDSYSNMMRAIAGMCDWPDNCDGKLVAFFGEAFSPDSRGVCSAKHSTGSHVEVAYAWTEPIPQEA